MQCKICGNEHDNYSIVAEERMFGMGDSFNYFVCGHCRCLQIEEFPSEIQRYYGKDYYSYNTVNNKISLRGWLVQTRNQYSFGDKESLIGKLANTYKPAPQYYSIIKKYCGYESNILDVGCGSGVLLKMLADAGYKNILGIDPFNSCDIYYENGVQIRKSYIHEIDDSFDFIMMNHSFEHMMDQEETLHSVKRLLKENGVCMVRVPISESYAFEKYKEKWVQLDAPRHYFLHSYKSMELLCRQTGLRITETICDSTEFQFAGSEKYERDIPLNNKIKLFSRRQIKTWNKEAEKINADKRGDQAIFLIQKN